jgi:hypothetical protein
MSPWSNYGAIDNTGFNSFNGINSGFDNFSSIDSGSGMLNQIYSMMSMLRMMQLYQAQNTARTTGNLPTNARVVNQPTTINQVTRPVNTVATNGNVTAQTNPATATTPPPIAANTVIKGNSVVLGRDLLTKVAQNPNQAVTFVRQELEKLAGSNKSWQVVNLFRTVKTTHKHGGKEDKALQPLLAKLAQSAIDQSRALGLSPAPQTVVTKTT